MQNYCTPLRARNETILKSQLLIFFISRHSADNSRKALAFLFQYLCFLNLKLNTKAHNEMNFLTLHSTPSNLHFILHVRNEAFQN